MRTVILQLLFIAFVGRAQQKKGSKEHVDHETSIWQVSVNVTIREALCFSASTVSAFTVHLLALSYDNEFLSALTIHRRNFTYNKRTSSYTYKALLMYESHSGLATHDCFAKGHIDCAPRADAVLIRFESAPNDPWAVDHIEVTVKFLMEMRGKDWHIWYFEHDVLRPCWSWMDSRAVYQIGPRNGLHIEHNYKYFPKTYERIRDWV
ncbi:hypothetical protein V3C99_011132 [Haemonchus contortus]|uniref:PLAT domain-containing protein n=1 Tax=Haemonchus contortus TaxID=6289 RepID=A0A7I4Y8C4_HAECO